MNVYIVGAGAVGTVSRRTARGIGQRGDYAPRELAAVQPVDADLAIVAVKAYDTDGAIETLRRALRDPSATTIVSPQNGVGNEEKLAAAFGADAVVACALTVPVDRDRDGHVDRATRAGSRSRRSVRARTTGSWQPSAGRARR